MLFEDSYNSIQQTYVTEFKDRGSKFIAVLKPFTREEHLKDMLQMIQSEYPKASHYCYAYRLGMDKNVFRVNDDGEPNGTAGRPILNRLYSAELTNVLLVVIRYFGGTKLGIPGLVNAYKTAAENCIQLSQIIKYTVQDYYKVTYSYEQTKAVMQLCSLEEVHIIEQDFQEYCTLTFSVTKSKSNKIYDSFAEIQDVKIEFLYNK